MRATLLFISIFVFILSSCKIKNQSQQKECKQTLIQKKKDKLSQKRIEKNIIIIKEWIDTTSSKVKAREIRIENLIHKEKTKYKAKDSITTKTNLTKYSQTETDESLIPKAIICIVLIVLILLYIIKRT